MSEETDRRVGLVRCADYDREAVERATHRCLDLLGGMGAFVQPGQRVLLKPNLVRAMSPDRAVTTHPAVVAAVARLVREAGGHPIIADSPGGPYSAAILRLTYRKTGMDQAAAWGEAELNYNAESTQVSYAEGLTLRRLDIIQALLDADVVINLPKLKTHNLTTLTVAVKNLFGLVPGSVKIGYHAKLQENWRFCEGLIDLLTYVKPALHIVDAVVGMEGNGPSGGDPRPIGALLAGADALAVDVAAAALVDIPPLDVPTTRAAAQRGLTTGRLEDIVLLGDPLAELRVPGFRRGAASAVDPGLLPMALLRLLTGSGRENGQSNGHHSLPRMARDWLGHQLVMAPKAGKKCIGCGYCVKHCPVGAIQVVDGLAHMDTNKCIRCYCCHELCPELAVELKRPWLGRLFMGNQAT